MNFKKIFSAVAAAAMLTACVGDLNTIPLNPTDVTSETAYGADEQGYVQGLAKIYFQLTSNNTQDLQVADGGASEFIRAFWSTQEVTADAAKCAWGDAWVNDLNNCTWKGDVLNDAVYAVYVRTLQGIAYVNEYLRQTSNDNLDLRGCSADVKAKVQQFRAEARFLRAYFYWEMFLRYGPVPLVKVTLDPNGDLLTGYSTRPTIKEFLDYLVSEVKGCEANLLDYQGTGEVDKPTARALYVRMMLYMASPRYAASTGVTWQQVVDAAEGFIADFGGTFSLYTDATGGVSAYNNAWLMTPYQDNNKEVIFFRNDAAIGWNGIYLDQPVGEGGQGGLCPSQNLVDMYDMADGSAPFTSYDETGAPVYTNGKPTVNAASGYSDAKMWENRDPRLASTVLYHGCQWGYTTTSKTNVIDVIYGHRDNPIGNQYSTPTGYYVRKYQPETILSSNHGGTARRLWKLFTYSELLLSYAEALNEVAGPTDKVCELLDQIRHRGGITGNVADRLDLTTKDAMRNFIRKERTIELAFEEHRWWDVRRWNVADKALGRNIYGIDVASDGTITRKVAQSRVWQDKFYLYPIPEEEVWKIGQDFQNDGWK